MMEKIYREVFAICAALFIVTGSVFIYQYGFGKVTKIEQALARIEKAQDEQHLEILLGIEGLQKVRVRVSAYTLSPDETDSDPSEGALPHSPPTPGATAATSRDQLWLLGKKVYVPGKGVWEINDVTDKDQKFTLDLCVDTKAEAKKIGNQVMEVIVL